MLFRLEYEFEYSQNLGVFKNEGDARLAVEVFRQDNSTWWEVDGLIVEWSVDQYTLPAPPTKSSRASRNPRSGSGHPPAFPPRACAPIPNGFVVFAHEVEEHAVLVYLANVYIHDAEYEFEYSQNLGVFKNEGNTPRSRSSAAGRFL